MKRAQNLWQWYVGLFGNAPEAAVASLVVAFLAVAASVGALTYYVSSRRYAAAVALALALGGTACACVRDYRRGRWSFISGVVMAIWLLLTVWAIGFPLWVNYGR